MRLTEELEAVQQIARDFTRRELVPLEESVIRREVERGFDKVPLIEPEREQQLTAAVRELGLWGIEVPEELGGAGLGLQAKAVALEEVNYSITPYRLPPESPNISYLDAVATSSQKQRYLEPLCRGDMTSALALTEPDAGADAAGIRTTAVKDGSEWVINGSKLWISWADTVDFFIVIAVTDQEKRSRGGMTAFLVDRDAPGLDISAPIPTMGEQRPFGLFFDNVRVADDAVLGEIGNAFPPLTNRLGVRRVEIGARCTGQAQRMIDMMCSYSLERHTFGAPLADRQSVQNMIADSVMELHAVRLMVHDAATALDAGERDIRLEASSVKVQATEMLSRVVDRAMQVHGAMGYSKELPIEYVYRNSRVLRILEGPSEIHRGQVAKLSIKRRASR
ncbi:MULTISPECIES: acyl-CoA dehydrogenase family protein [unclassified Microbacterium]|uniref:acyl-CoA dehydrogenase family protein n=1 Tax=unclassified Microbacterium TaxID=2609290 RepID=UPI000C3F7CEE|nr:MULTISPECIES: acyl-CoA dehydrogenase family protein [unclassified Microbacterium]MBU19035.1 benzylsuccinyl-CoA dehydrogenase [Microbacterium sp.]HBU42933.1 benzylsuccinyl-CoA dehydrogenase [Microbacterium sp.]|tara:strand:+ start:1584 stop:2762 length:1179 start_codon:yes stop_codon:yes gene_type:complete